MPLTILTYLKEKFKMLAKFLTIPRFWGPVATIVFTVLYHLLAIQFGFTVAVGWLWVFAVLGAFIGGRKAGLIAATWAALYAYYVMPAGDWVFTVQRVVIGFLLTGIVGWQTRELRKYYANRDAMHNGNAVKLEEALKFIREAKEGLKQAEARVRLGEDRLGNLLSGVVGYKALRQTINDVQAWHADPENIKKLRDMQEAEGDG